MQATIYARQCEANVKAESVTDSLPDRLVNPEEYEPVQPTTEEHTDNEVVINKEEPNRMNPVYTYGSIS